MLEEARTVRGGRALIATEAPNQAGLVMRMLAPDGGALARGMEAAFHVAAVPRSAFSLHGRK